MDAVATDVQVRWLNQDEYARVADAFTSHGEPPPDNHAAILALEKDGEIVGFYSFHRVLMLGLTHVSPKFQTVGASAMKILASTAEQAFAPGDSLFMSIDAGAEGFAERFGCHKVGTLYRRDF